MNDTERHNDDEHNGIRNMLRRLPRVKASPDFERRLADALKKDPAEKRATGFFAGLRIPAPAYSFATLAVLGAAVYYAFFRTGAIPDATSDMAKLPASSGSVRSDSQAMSGEDELARVRKDAAKDDLREFASKNEPSPAPTRSKVSSSKEAAASATLKKTAEGKMENDRQQSAGVDAKSVAAPAQVPRQLSAEESAQEISQPKMKKEEEEQARGVTNAMPPPPEARAKQAYPGQKSLVAPQNRPLYNNYNAASPAASSVAVFEMPLDSIRMRDSLRADSLRKAHADSLKKMGKPDH